MVGDILTIEGIDYEVVWNGGPLLAPRDQKADDSYEASPRPYHKTGRHTKPTTTHLTPPEVVVTRSPHD